MTYDIKTLAVRSGIHRSQFNEHSEAMYLTSSFVFENAAQAAARFSGEEPGNIYSRFTNPTVTAMQERLAALEGAEACVATSSGMSAILTTAMATLKAGDHVLCSSSVFGATVQLFSTILAKFGLNTTFVNGTDPAEWRKQVRPETRLLFGETLGNPGLDVLDIPSVSAIAHEAGLPLMVDSTFTTPWLLKPFEHGADLLFHSATKFLGGHGNAIGGVLVDSGNFDWRAGRGFETLTEPYEGFHGMVFDEESATRAFLLRARREGLRDFGACMAPMTAFLLLQGVETLALRMPRHVENTRKAVRFLAGHDAVSGVLYPELSQHPDRDLASRLLPRGAGAVFSFDLKGGRDAGRRFIEALRVFSHLANVGDAKSLVIHPASTTHYRMSEEDLSRTGIGPGTVRLSIGLEDPDDLIEDLSRGLRAAAKGA